MKLAIEVSGAGEVMEAIDMNDPDIIAVIRYGIAPTTDTVVELFFSNFGDLRSLRDSINNFLAERGEE